MANKLKKKPAEPVAEPEASAAPVRPRHTVPDAFEQNPLSGVSERITLQATAGLDDAGRVREAMRIVIAEGVSIQEAARRCHVAPSCLAEWREKYLSILNDEPSIADRPLMDHGATVKDADLVRIPQAARDHFAENWERLVEVTKATPSTFRQHPVQLFLENSPLTSWLYHEGKLDRGVFAGAAVAVTVLVLTASFMKAGHFYRQDMPPPEIQVSVEGEISRAAMVALQFFRAETAEEKMKFVRGDDQAKALMAEFFSKHPAKGFPDAMLTKAMPGSDIYALEFDIPSLNRKHLCVVVDRGGKMLVDWETSSLYQEVHLEELRKQKPTKPVRVAARVQEDSYYNFGFTNRDYTCYRLAYPGLELDLFAYAKKDSIDDQTLKALMRPIAPGIVPDATAKENSLMTVPDAAEKDSLMAVPELANERQITAVLEVRYPEGADLPSNQVEIVRILNEEWVAP